MHRQARRLQELVLEAASLKRSVWPLDDDLCRDLLADELEYAFLKVIVVLAVVDFFRASSGWGRVATERLEDAAGMFERRGRPRIAAEIARLTAELASGYGLVKRRDDARIRGRRVLRRTLSGLPWLGDVFLDIFSGYGYAPMRVLLIAIVLFVLSGTGFVLFHQHHSLIYAAADYFGFHAGKDFDGDQTGQRWVSLAEAAIAIVVNGFFITLLAKKWFNS
jgi:hypothetical protein